MFDSKSDCLNRSLSVPNIPSFFVKSSPAGELSNVNKKYIFKNAYLQKIDHVSNNINVVKHSSYEQLVGTNSIQQIFKKPFAPVLDKDIICSSISNLKLNEEQSNIMHEVLEDVEMKNESDCFTKEAENCDRLISTNDNSDPLDIQQCNYQVDQQVRKRNIVSPNITDKNQVFLNKNQRKFNFRWYFIICLAIFSIVVLILSNITTEKARLPISQNLNKLKQDIVQQVFGQNEQIMEIIDTLSNIQQNSFKLLSFVGSTGTGKTHVINILKQHLDLIEIFPNQLKNEFESVIKTLKTKILGNRLSVIVIEDLKSDNLDLLKEFLSFLPKRENLLIICIFNTQYTDENLNYSIKSSDVDLIKSFLKKTDITDYNVIQFNGFNIDNAREWLRNYILVNVMQNDIDEQVFEKVLDKHDVEYMGFKGLRAKALLEVGKVNEMYN